MAIINDGQKPASLTVAARTMRKGNIGTMDTGLSEAERQQLEQTVEMFEAIVESQPYDCQSLEILKEAYAKLGRYADVIRTSKRLAKSYLQLGQVSSAILEYEAVLHTNPNDQEALEALAQIDARVIPSGPPIQKAAEHKGYFKPGIEEPPTAVAPPSPPQPKTVESIPRYGEKTAEAVSSPPPGTEILAPKLTLTQPPKAPTPGATVKGSSAIPRVVPTPQVIINDGRDEMYRIFVESKLVAPGDFEQYWPTPPVVTDKIIEPFIQIIADQRLVPIETSLKLIVEKTRIPFIPLDRYDIDYELARQFPAQVCLKWCVLPFDRMGKTIFVATANPFNKTALQELSEATNNRLIYYLAAPIELTKSIKKAFRI